MKLSYILLICSYTTFVFAVEPEQQHHSKPFHSSDSDEDYKRTGVDWHKIKHLPVLSQHALLSYVPPKPIATLPTLPDDPHKEPITDLVVKNGLLYSATQQDHFLGNIVVWQKGTHFFKVKKRLYNPVLAGHLAFNKKGAVHAVEPPLFGPRTYFCWQHDTDARTKKSYFRPRCAGGYVARSTRPKIPVVDTEALRVRQWLKGHEAEVRCLAVDDRYLYSGSEDGTLGIWKKSSHELLVRIPLEAKPTKLAIDVDSHCLYVGMHNGQIKVFNTNQFEFTQEQRTALSRLIHTERTKESVSPARLLAQMHTLLHTQTPKRDRWEDICALFMPSNYYPYKR